MKTQSAMSIDDLLSLPTTVNLETAGRALGIGRTLAHELARKGEFPVPVMRHGNRYRIATPEVLRILGVHAPGVTV
ncbi:DNA-binding protein [Actinoplanes sp. NPDC051859]|uniref:DNA-binding protein n=1 Tax=Actinoplanes sp. NPDC051859 TaxID=3363909 RepID=UPI00378DDF5E